MKTVRADSSAPADLSGTTLLLLPGLLCDAAVWADQCRVLAERGVRCVVADYGMADSIDAMASAALDALDGAGFGATRKPPFAMAGHSMGGRVALEVMRRVPGRVARIALLDTGYQARAAGEAGEAERAGRHALLAVAQTEGMRAMGAMWSRGMVHPDRLGTAVHEDILQMIERATPELFDAQIAALLNRPDATDVLGRIDVPTLILCGRDDAWSPLARHVDMQAITPSARLAVVEDCGHMSTMERPDAVTGWLCEWLSWRASDCSVRDNPEIKQDNCLN